MLQHPAKPLLFSPHAHGNTKKIEPRPVP